MKQFGVFLVVLIILLSVSVRAETEPEMASDPSIADCPITAPDGALLGTTLHRSFLDRLPLSNRISTAFVLYGGIAGSGNLHIHGGPVNANVFLFDGLEMTDPLTGVYSCNMNPDIVENVELRTGGFDASYGRALGGIVNIKTRSGTNDFHGVFRVHYTDEGWHDASDHPVFFGDEQYYEPALTLEGPIWKDHLWFVASYQHTQYSDSVRMLDRYGAENDAYRDKDTDHTFQSPFAKLTFKPTDSHRFTLQYASELTSYDSLPYGYLSTSDTIVTQESGSKLVLLTWQWQATPALRFDTRIGQMESILNSLPSKQSTDNPRSAAFYDMYYGSYYNNSDQWREDTRDRFEIDLAAQYRIEDFWGQHELNAGLAFQDASREDFNRYPGGASYTISQIPVGDPNNPDYFIGDNAYRSLLVFPGSSEASNRYTALYVEDDWALSDMLCVSIGLRYESSVFSDDEGSESAPAWKWGWFGHADYLDSNYSPAHFARMEFDAMLAPRIGITMHLLEDHSLTSYFHYGRYYNPFDLSLVGMFQPFTSDNTATVQQDYLGPEWHDMNRDGIPDEDFFFDDTNWYGYEDDSGSDIYNYLDPDIDPEYSDNYILGLEYVMSPQITLNANLLYNRTNDMIEDVGLFQDDEGNVVWTYLGGITNGQLDPEKKYDPIEGESYDRHVYWITNARGAVREYRGVELNAYAHDQWYEIQASYTYSESEATITDQPPGDSGIAQFSGQYDTWAISQNLFGETPWSARHYIKLAGAVHHSITDWYEVSLGMNGALRSGFHYSKRTLPPYTFDPTDSTNDFEDSSTWTGRPPYRSYAWFYPEGRGTYELPSMYSIDMSLQNTFNLQKLGSLSLIFDVFNVTDFQGTWSQSDVFNPNRPDFFGEAIAWNAPRSYRIGLKYAF